MIRTRFAPSPTGDPHIGNIRSALFAYLFAKKNGGEFLLRIEDTDRERHNEGSIGVIKDALNWLNILPENFDTPMVQSERLPIYKEAALKLVNEGKAYVCTCSKERLEQVREDQKAKNLPPKYDRHCRELSLAFEEGCVIRMKIPDSGSIKFNDLVRGEVEIPYSAVDDQVILKSDGFPTYHLAHVVDDHEMEITHVIRAEEWLPSTPKHILLNEMLGFKTPEYAHLPVILSPTKGKLSKRDGAVGIMAYRELGYLPEAIINFMVLLGWNPKTDEEFFTLSELEKRFDITQVNKAPAVFDINKLNYFNHYYMMALDNQRLYDLLDPEAQQILDRFDRKLPTEQTTKQNIISDIKARISSIPEFKEALKFLTVPKQLEKNDLIFRKSNAENTQKGLKEALKVLESLSSDDWYYGPILRGLEKAVNNLGLSNGDVFWPFRYALTGELKSPPPEMVATWLGKDESIKRISKAIELLS